MINKRGLSPDEIDKLDPELFELLFIFDSVIEPNGARFEHMKFSNLAHLILMSSGNLTEKGLKAAKVTDWDMYGLLSNKTSTELAEEEDKRKQQQAKLQYEQMKADLVKEEAAKKNKGKPNGKV